MTSGMVNPFQKVFKLPRPDLEKSLSMTVRALQNVFCNRQLLKVKMSPRSMGCRVDVRLTGTVLTETLKTIIPF